ncbi:hypothetical protein PIB30_071161 [Stylosanthes scabra]|uniref:Uncharacterized protein n=1 Tax=Stylosanthes scabra TaxID=79078 RepID=A0ABU6XLW2_9FABA|nr:hypothetical protein [Stylosanthes scabra]
MARKGNEAAASSTPSRSRTTKNSSRGRDDGFPADRFDSQIHYDRWKTMENRGYTHERIIRLPKGEPDFWHDRIEGLGWGFMIPFTENDIRRYLNINIDLPGPGVTNVDPKQHGTTFDLNHAILIYVLMTKGVVNLPHIMRDVLLKRLTENSRNLLPYAIFISRLASRF